MTLSCGPSKAVRRKPKLSRAPSLNAENFASISNQIFLDRALDGLDKLVWIALRVRAFGDKFACWQSLDCIVEDSRLSRSTVQRRLKQLEAKRYLKVEYRNQKSSLYTLMLPNAETGEVMTPSRVLMALSPDGKRYQPSFGTDLFVKGRHHDGVTLASRNDPEGKGVRFTEGESFLFEGMIEAKLVSFGTGRPKFSIDDTKLSPAQFRSIWRMNIDFDQMSGHPGPETDLPGD
jgi:hypothetical protein